MRACRHFLPEQQGNTPSPCQRNHGVYYSAQNSVLTAAKPCNNVKLKQSYTSPVRRTYYGQNQRNSIGDHRRLPPLMVFVAKCGYRVYPFTISFIRTTQNYACQIKSNFFFFIFLFFGFFQTFFYKSLEYHAVLCYTILNISFGGSFGKEP